MTGFWAGAGIIALLWLIWEMIQSAACSPPDE